MNPPRFNLGSTFPNQTLNKKNRLQFFSHEWIVRIGPNWNGTAREAPDLKSKKNQ